MPEEHSEKSAYVIAYAFVNIAGVITGLFIGWVIWA